MFLKHQKCGNVWNYKGNGKYASCTNCYGKVNVKESRCSYEEIKDAAIQKVTEFVKRILGEYGFSINEGVFRESLYDLLKDQCSTTPKS